MKGDQAMRHWEADRYFISVDGGEEYLVELEAYEGVGWCNCRQFECVHQPLLERGDPTIRRCKHLHKAFVEYAQIQQQARIPYRKEE